MFNPVHSPDTPVPPQPLLNGVHYFCPVPMTDSLCVPNPAAPPASHSPSQQLPLDENPLKAATGKEENPTEHLDTEY
ncbi:hypothetical protein QQF64_001628 [Cirrhinus molitorella]|uniref:Uncharacterized protein n=1 Tax=Cirrhinus molitorella TaxID=172907 RepID=A0ABR3P0M5_9TELE